VKIASLSDVKAHFSEFLARCDAGPVIVTRNGRPAGILVRPPKDEEELDRFILAHTPRFRRLLDTARERIRKSGGVSHRDFWKRISPAGS